jgi:hypothetical protein
MKNTIGIFILFTFMLSLQAFSIDEVLVTGTRDGSGTGGSVSLTGSVYNRTESAAKDKANEAARKAEAESRKKAAAACRAAGDTAFENCSRKALNDLTSLQGGCAALASTAGITTVAGGGATATGIGAGPGLVLLGLGTVEGAAAAYCYQIAANEKGLDDIDCKSKLRLKSLECDRISPKE